MKKIVLTLSAMAILLVSQSASAGGFYWGGYSGWGSGDYYRSLSPYHYGYGRGFGVSYGHYYPRYRHRYRRWDSGSFVGGLVLGSLLSQPRRHRHYETVTYRRPATTTRTREVVYVNRSGQGNRAPVTRGRSLLKDLEGNCFERIHDEQGNEIRVQLDAAECNF